MVSRIMGIVVVNRADKPRIWGLCVRTASTNNSGADVDAEVDHIEPAALEHHGHQILADVMQIPLDRTDQDAPPDGLPPRLKDAASECRWPTP